MKIKWTLNKKLILMMAALSAAVILIMFILNIYYEQALLTTLQQKTSEITESLHLAIEEITKQEKKDYKNLASYLNKLKAGGIKEISIIDSATRIRASTDPEKVGRFTSKYITELIFKSEVGEFLTKEGDLYHIILPVVAKGEHQGYIHLEVSTEDISSLMKTHMRNRILATLIIFLCGFVVAVWLSSRYTRPIRRVVDSARAVASGDLDISLPIKEHDEIGDLKRSFNQMAKKLKEFRALEERWREIEHLSTIGDLSRSIAHEIRNPLNFISLSVDHLSGQIENENQKKLLNSIKEEVKRLDSLVSNFLAYGKPLNLNRKSTDILELIDDTLSLVEARAEKTGIRILKEYPVGSLTVKIDPELIKTCLINIFQNAFHAMPEGGTMRISVEKANQEIVISVSDTGVGVDESIQEKVFEPFFTTRQRGVGLGLALTKRVVEEHGGRVKFVSKKGAGSTFTIILPERVT
ncbi:MAG: HAMP domain-containing protein [Nitrospirae bacterium]|nr:HAMP domain-containing protein [Nitrospirota bacterium]